MAQNVTFAPHFGTGVSIGTTATSSSTSIGLGDKTLCLTNRSAVDIYVRTSSVTPTVAIAYNDYLVPSYNQVTISKSADHGYLGAVSPDGSGILHVIAGEGY